MENQHESLSGVAKENVMKRKYQKNFAASTAKPTVKYQRQQKINDTSAIKGTSQRKNAKLIARCEKQSIDVSIIDELIRQHDKIQIRITL